MSVQTIYAVSPRAKRESHTLLREECKKVAHGSDGGMRGPELHEDGSENKSLKNLTNWMFCSADNCRQNADLLQLPLMLSGLGTNSPYVLVFFGANRVAERERPSEHTVATVLSFDPGKRAEEFSLFPKIVAEP